MPHSPNRKTLFLAALEVSAGDRAGFLSEACGADQSLRADVERMLDAHEAGGPSALDLTDTDADTVPVEDELGRPDRIGPYRILGRIGEGGMGYVYLARQESPLTRVVALKIIKPGMDTTQVIARFAAERQTLAQMEHPNIARVLDAGVTEGGRPFFAMEYVAGSKITEHCDRHGLATRERLRIFREVCAAVQHAHRRGVVHRDIKPSNVLVVDGDDGPQVKVIDFGIAKALDPEAAPHTMLTAAGQLVGTPEYMSPEQADGQLDIDTRSDVYSLGVLLYELLVGCLPFDPDDLRQAGWEAMRRQLREEEPPRPSTRVTPHDAVSERRAKRRGTDTTRLRSEVTGDLDRITLKALEKDRERRYESPSDLAADLNRYLRREPVLATPPSFRYRARRFCERNPVPVLLAATILTGLVAGSVIVLGMYQREQAARELADREATRLVEVRRFLVGVLSSADPLEWEGRDPTVTEVLERARERLYVDAATDADVRVAALEALGQSFMALYRFDDALEVYREAWDAGQQVDVYSIAERRQLKRNVAEALRSQETRAALEEAVPLIEEMIAAELAESPRDVDFILSDVGLLVKVLDLQGRAPADGARAQRMLDQLEPDLSGRERIRAYVLRADLAKSRNREEEAITWYLRADAAFVEADLDTTASYADCLNHLAGAYARLGRYEEARETWLATHDAYVRAYGEPHRFVALALKNIATGYYRCGDLEGALEWCRRALDMRAAVYGADHPQVGTSTTDYGVYLMEAGRDEEAARYLQRAIELFEGLGEAHPIIGWPASELARLRYRQGRYGDAEQLWARAESVLNPERPADEVREVRMWRGLALAKANTRERAAETRELLAEAVPWLEAEGEGWAEELTTVRSELARVEGWR